MTVPTTKLTLTRRAWWVPSERRPFSAIDVLQRKGTGREQTLDAALAQIKAAAKRGIGHAARL